MQRKIAILVAVIVVLAICWSASQRSASSTAQQVEPSPEKSTIKRQLIGTTSCSASVCHGGNELGQLRSEATTWRALDPHSRAYDTLLSPRSQAMAKLLWKDGTLAQDAPLCLKCHVHPTYDNARPNFRKQDGVGCESCHGAAQDWLTPHYLAAWQQADKKTHAMADTKSLPGRANVCVTCHVGTPDANVDHDLIAAGHPALRFEFSSYLANLPAHWDSKKDKKANSTGDYLDFEVRAWAAGQSASLAGAMDLLAYRADPANGKPWPEFAELDCFSCHHDLTARSWRQDKDHLEKRKPGSLVWNDWYAAFAPGYLQRYGLFEQPDRARIAHKALGIAKISRLEPLPRYPFNDPHSSGGLLISVASEAVLRNWQEATQHFLLLTAIKQMRQDNKQPTDARIEARIDKLRGEIAFPPGYNSPHWLGPPAVQEKK